MFYLVLISNNQEIVLPIESTASRGGQPSGTPGADFQLKKFLFTLSSIKESNPNMSASSECICFNGSK